MKNIEIRQRAEGRERRVNAKVFLLFIVIVILALSSTFVFTQQAGNIGTKPLPSIISSTEREPNVVFPRVITPNNDGINDEVFFLFRNETDAPVKGAVYDLKSARIVDLQIGGFYKGLHTLLVWNGRDESGAVVSSGIYIYKIEIGNFNYTGTVAVLR